MIRLTYGDDYRHAISTLPPMSVIDLGSRFGWGWRCEECGRGHVEEFAQEGCVLICERCGKSYFCE